MEELCLITLILSILYAAFLFWCIAGWLRLKEVTPGNGDAIPAVPVSVIIPARNEEENILHCLSDFPGMDYPAGSFELIVVDDHSADATSQVVEKFIREFPSIKIRLLKMQDGSGTKIFKKQSISEAVKLASGELIITTDADCRRGRDWLRILAQTYHEQKPEMISAPVLYENEKGWFEKIQSLEFLGLMAIGASSIANRRPFLCNGANLAFTKKVFLEVGGYQSKNNYASGDDTQLMLKVASHGSGRIIFVRSGKAAVTTTAKGSLKEMLSQRNRWASKIPRQMGLFTFFIAAVAYFLHAGLLVSAISVICGGPLYYLAIPLFIKIIPEFMLLAVAAYFYKKSDLLYLFLPAQVIYPLYISLVGISSLAGSYEWKGRKAK